MYAQTIILANTMVLISLCISIPLFLMFPFKENEEREKERTCIHIHGVMIDRVEEYSSIVLGRQKAVSCTARTRPRSHRKYRGASPPPSVVPPPEILQAGGNPPGADRCIVGGGFALRYWKPGGVTPGRWHSKTAGVTMPLLG